MKLYILVLALLYIVASGQSAIVFSENFGGGQGSPINPEEPGSQWIYNAIPSLGFISNEGVLITEPSRTKQCVTYERSFAADTPAAWLTNIAHNVLIPKIGPFFVESDELIRVESTLSTSSTGTENHPYGDAVEDPEDNVSLATNGIVLVNTRTGFTVCFFLTNKGIWMFQDGVGTLEPGGPMVRTWTSAQRIRDRNPSDVHDLVLEYNRKDNAMRWYIEGELVHEHTNPGFPAFTVIEERVSGEESVSIPASDLESWTTFLWNGHFPGGLGEDANGKIRGGYHINGVKKGYETPKKHVFKAPKDDIDVITYGATGCVDHYKYQIKIEKA